VDLVAGPDGALYIADFYNRIIGHYEVDLMHPGRDRHRGRIWRLSAATDSSSVESVTLTDTHHNYGIDLRALSAEQLIAVLRAASPVQRRLAMQVLEGMQTPQATAKLTGLLSDTDPRLRRSALRLLALRGALSARQVSTLASDEDEVVRTHVMRALRELSPPEFSRWKGTALLLAAFGDPSPLVRRAAVSAAAVHRKQALVQPLLRLIHTTELGDVHLRHAARIALRDHLLEETWFRELTAASPLAMDRLVIADLCLAVKTPAAAGYIAANVSFLGSRQPHRLAEYLQFASAAVPESAAADVVAIVRERFAGNVELQKELLESLRQGFAARGSQVPQPVRAWALDLALSTLGMKTPDDVDAVVIRPALSWTEFEHPEHAGVRDCWGTTTSRLASDGVSPMILFSSFERGEAKTGIYRSDAFEAGPSLSFFAAGHDGSPAAPLQQKNSIRLCDAVTGDVLRHSPPPRNDVAQWIEWQTSDIAGRRVVVELVDGDPGTAYAWLAAGRFSDERLNPSDAGPRCLNAAQLMADFQLDGLRPAIVQFFSSDALPRATRSALASAVTQLNPDARLRAAALTPGISACQEPLVRQALQSVADRDPTAAASILESVFLVASPAEQSLLAESLAGDAAGAEELVRLMSIGRASVRLLLRPSIQQRLQAVATAATIEQAALLAASLPAEDESISQLLTTRRAELADGGGSLEAGQELFRKNCQTCHQLAGQGKQVGPNLDGIGNRGLDRLLEDVLAPNRNVDVAFRATTIVTGQGLAISGLLKELPDGRLSITDSQARETRLAASDVDERVTSTASPMPANFGETLTAGQLRDLCRFLLAQRQTVEPSGR
jgi:putative heme-binding domain-containing protein